MLADPGTHVTLVVMATRETPTMTQPFVVTLTGPSASGKSVLERALERRGFSRVVSTTTRPPRTGERDGVDYYFRTHRQFAIRQMLGGFVEVTEFGGHRYGVTVGEFQRAFAASRPVVVVVEPNGAAQVRDYCLRRGWGIGSVFVTNTLPVLIERFLRRDPAADPVWTAARLAQLATSELGWLTEGTWDLVVERFDETTEERALHRIAELATSGECTTRAAVSA